LHVINPFDLLQDWSLGVLYTKIVCGLTMMSPDWWLKHSLEKVCIISLIIVHKY